MNFLCGLGELCVHIPRKDEEKSSGMPDACGVVSARPLPARYWRQPILRVRPRQLAAQPLFELRDGIRERHGTIVIAEQLLCGAG
jgi:hypothetical protein